MTLIQHCNLNLRPERSEPSAAAEVPPLQRCLWPPPFAGSWRSCSWLVQTRAVHLSQTIRTMGTMRPLRRRQRLPPPQRRQAPPRLLRRCPVLRDRRRVYRLERTTASHAGMTRLEAAGAGHARAVTALHHRPMRGRPRPRPHRLCQAPPRPPSRCSVCRDRRRACSLLPQLGCR